MLGNPVGDTCSVRLMEWRNHIFIEHEWDAFTEDNDIVKGDALFFTYT
jgi:hypothetical protein